MWILFAFGSALFSGATAILAKCGIRNTDSNVVTALRTVVVLLFSWLCYFKALQTGPASVVVPIDKLSILVTVAFAYFVFGEKLQKRSTAGLIAITAGTLLLLK
ncbi:MAG: EamA family transporter [Treponema sp.]|nr:EamA family transporter [Treponema sp.]